MQRAAEEPASGRAAPDAATIAGLIAARAGDQRPGLLTADRTYTHAEVVACARKRAGWLLERRRPGPFHVAVLLDNTEDYVFWLQAASLAGAVVVGANPTHRGDELVRDLHHTECQLLVTSQEHLALLDGRDVGHGLGTVSFGSERVLVVDDPAAGAELEGTAASVPPDPAAAGVTPESLGYLLFTSGTSGAPKACRCTQGRLARIGAVITQMFSLTADDVCYLPMPLFHSNALMAGWAPALAAGAAIALPSTGRFSASGFLPDVRKFGATYFNYVGKPLAYVLATPERPDDADNPLVRAFGNEGAATDVERFATRFGCTVTDAYGSTEGGATVARTPDTPPGALGRAPEGTVVLDPASGLECPPARFDAKGRLVNAEEAIGELVSKSGASGFEGYWRNDEAEHARLRQGWYWTGDLAYRDEAGFFYFAGRDHEWLRVDGENFAAAPVERILERLPGVLLAAVYAVPDPVVGDQVMAALELEPGAGAFDPERFAAFLDEQEDLGTKWAPRFVRVAARLPLTATNKVVKRTLRAERWHTADPVWWRPRPGDPYSLLSPDAAAELDAALSDRVL
ncbi:MAG: AMP-binding protein [Actinomycetota bacterium]|nr:AMP-binding protein [Actinomycetota bacterium]